MKKYINHINGAEQLLYLLLLLVFGYALYMIIGSRVPKLKLERKKFFAYVLIQILVFVAFLLILYNLKNTSLNQRLISLQVYMTVTGIAHLKVFYDVFKKFEAKKFWQEVVIAFCVILFLAGFLVVITKYFDEIQYIFYLVSALLFFIIPMLCYQLFEYSVSIPVKLHKRWFYPLNDRYPTPKASEMRNIIILNLVFQKKEDDEQIINFKVKAPKAIDYGRLFYYFINDYNEKNPNSQINFLDAKNQPYGWYFYTKPKWFSSSEYIDPDLAIDTNNIKDGTTIICQRI